MKVVLGPLAERPIPLDKANAPCKSDPPAVRANDPPEIVNALVHWMLLTVMLPEEMTTLMPAPPVMTTSLAGPGTAPPLQLVGLFHETASPPPVQLMVWPRAGRLRASRPQRKSLNGSFITFLAWVGVCICILKEAAHVRSVAGWVHGSLSRNRIPIEGIRFIRVPAPGTEIGCGSGTAQRGYR